MSINCTSELTSDKHDGPEGLLFMERSLFPMLCSLPIVLAVTRTALSDEVPNLHVEQLCRGIANQLKLRDHRILRATGG